MLSRSQLHSCHCSGLLQLLPRQDVQGYSAPTLIVKTLWRSLLLWRSQSQSAAEESLATSSCDLVSHIFSIHGPAPLRFGVLASFSLLAALASYCLQPEACKELLHSDQRRAKSGLLRVQSVKSCLDSACRHHTR